MPSQTNRLPETQSTTVSGSLINQYVVPTCLDRDRKTGGAPKARAHPKVWCLQWLFLRQNLQTNGVVRHQCTDQTDSGNRLGSTMQPKCVAATKPNLTKRLIFPILPALLSWPDNQHPSEMAHRSRFRLPETITASVSQNYSRSLQHITGQIFLLGNVLQTGIDIGRIDHGFAAGGGE